MAVESSQDLPQLPEVQEALRLRAVQARKRGYAVADIAAILDVPEEAVARWCSGDGPGVEPSPGLLSGASGPSALIGVRDGTRGSGGAPSRSGGAGSSALPVPFNT